jgi:hypothetical protein
MIRIKPATRESRPRDRKRYRAVLSVGDSMSIHLTTMELAALIADAWTTLEVLITRREQARRKGGGR